MTRNRDTYPARCVGQQAIVTLRPLPCSPVGSPRCPPAKSVRGKRRNRLTGPAATASSTPTSKSCRVRPGSSYWMHQQGSPSFPRPSHGTAPGAALRQHYLSPTRSPRTARLLGRLWRHGHPSARAVPFCPCYSRVDLSRSPELCWFCVAAERAGTSRLRSRTACSRGTHAIASSTLITVIRGVTCVASQ